MPARRPRAISTAQQLTGYSILLALGLIVVWLLVRQSTFHPAVTALQTPPLAGFGPSRPEVSAQAAALLPQVAGFTPLGPVQIFGPENLSDKIDGKAELYLSAGFQTLAVQSFTLAQPAGAYLEVFLYDMGEPQNAYAVFSAQRRAGAADVSFRPNAYATSNALFFTAGHFYVEMILDRAVPEVAGVLAPFTTALAAKLPATAASNDLAALFPRANLVADSVRLQAADAFGLAGFNNVYTAEYLVSGGQATAFLALRSTVAEATAAARRYQEFLQDNGFRAVQDPAIPEHITVLALEDWYEALVVVQETLAGVHEAPSLAAALELVRQLQEALAKKP
ncbi:MAG: DUF6599 family protein [Desulfobacca sp.]|uniref:DUF6599 family protein n=1 Tax=Desulfobacca sp. TaxID=2067990 RepID=UPI00404919D8